MAISDKKRAKYERKLPKAKKRQSRLSRAAGLGALAGASGLVGAAIIRKPHLANPAKFGENISNAAKKARNLRAPDLSDPAKRAKYADKVKDKAFIVGTGSAAVGGIGSLNFAGIQRKEAKLEKK